MFCLTFTECQTGHSLMMISSSPLDTVYVVVKTLKEIPIKEKLMIRWPLMFLINIIINLAFSSPFSCSERVITSNL